MTELPKECTLPPGIHTDVNWYSMSLNQRMLFAAKCAQAWRRVLYDTKDSVVEAEALKPCRAWAKLCRELEESADE